MGIIGGADGPTAVFVSAKGAMWWILLPIVLAILILLIRKKK